MAQQLEQGKQSIREKILEGLLGVKEKEEAGKREKIVPGDVVAGKYGTKDGFRLVIDSFQSGVEANYYWLLRFMENKEDFGLRLSGDRGKVLKLKDIFAAGESSSLWGSVEQRKAIQQEKVSSYLATIGKMIKDLFQIVRELRVIDERLEYYNGYNNGDNGASIALKSVWVDLVEGGAKNPGSVTGLASQVGFIILPDLFYRIHPKEEKDVDKLIKMYEKDGLNKKVLEVLSRKLSQFIIWKSKTEKEIRDRRKFVLAYLRQHYNSIRMYISWIKPYLKNIRQLQMGSSYEKPHIVSSFETSAVELELLGIRNKYSEKTEIYSFEVEKNFKKYFPCVLVKIRFIALPEMPFQKEYQRGPMHMGRTEINIFGCVATEKDIEDYKKEVDKEDFELISSLDDSLNALKDTLFEYLKQAQENYIPEIKDEVIAVMERTGSNKSKAIEALKKMKSVESAVSYLSEKGKSDGILTPFKAVYDGFKEILNLETKKSSSKGLPLKKEKEDSEKKNAMNEARSMAWILYDVYKKSHGYLNPL